MTWLATESQAKTNLKKHTYWLPSKSMAMLCTSESILKGFEWIFHWCKYFWRCFWPLAWRMRTAAWQIRQNCKVKKFSKREVFNEKIIFLVDKVKWKCAGSFDFNFKPSYFRFRNWLWFIYEVFFTGSGPFHHHGGTWTSIIVSMRFRVWNWPFWIWI